MEDAAVPYPLHREVDVVLRDGATVRIRPARADDRERVEDYLIGLSDESRYFRFGGASVDVSEIARRSTEIDYLDHLTLLAVGDAGAGEVIGGAQYIREGDVPRAEVSVSVADALQGRGLGSPGIAEVLRWRSARAASIARGCSSSVICGASSFDVRAALSSRFWAWRSVSRS